MKSNKLSAFMLYMLPFIIHILMAIILYDDILLRCKLAGDSFAGGASLGLSWLVGQAYRPFHYPSYFMSQLTSTLLYISGGIDYDQHAYAALTYLVNFAYLVCAALWVSFLSAKSHISGNKIFICALVSASFPTSMSHYFAWVGPFFALGAFSFPIFLSIFTVFQEKSWCSSRILYFAMLILGFFWGSILLMTAVAASIGCGVFIYSLINRREAAGVTLPATYASLPMAALCLLILFSRHHASSATYFTNCVAPIILVILVMAIASFELRTRQTANPFPLKCATGVSQFLSIFVLLHVTFLFTPRHSLAIIYFILAIALYSKYARALLYAVILPFVTGWICSQNIAVSDWLEILKLAIMSKGGAATSSHSIPEFLTHPLELVTVNPWGLFFYIAIFGTAIILAIPKIRKDTSVKFTMAITLASLLICLAQTSNITTTHWDDYSYFANSFRYYTPIIGATGIFILMSMSLPQNMIRIPIIVLAYALTLASILRFNTIMSKYSEEFLEMKSEISALAKSTAYDTFVCQHVLYPAECNKQWSYHQFSNISKSVVSGGQNYIYITPPDKIASSGERKFLMTSKRRNLQGKSCAKIRDFSYFSLYDCNFE